MLKISTSLKPKKRDAWMDYLESADAALLEDINESEYSRKQLAVQLYPDLDPERAYKRFKEKLNTNRDDTGIFINEAIDILKMLDNQDHFMRFICTELGYEMPKKINDRHITEMKLETLSMIKQSTDVLSNAVSKLIEMEKMVKK